jgi:hypothetical protein
MISYLNQNGNFNKKKYLERKYCSYFKLSKNVILGLRQETVIAAVRPAVSKDPKDTAGKYDIAGTLIYGEPIKKLM